MAAAMITVRFVNLLCIFNVRSCLDEVSLLLVQQAQLEQGEGDQVVVVSDAALAAGTQNTGRNGIASLSLSARGAASLCMAPAGLPGQDLREAELRLQQPAQVLQTKTLQHLDQAAVIWVEL